MPRGLVEQWDNPGQAAASGRDSTTCCPRPPDGGRKVGARFIAPSSAECAAKPRPYLNPRLSEAAQPYLRQALPRNSILDTPYSHSLPPSGHRALVYLYFDFFVFGSKSLSCLVASSRSMRASAIAKVRLSHFAESGLGSTPFSLRKTRQAPKAVRLLPSRKG